MTTAGDGTEGLGQPVRALLARAYELAGSALAGVDEAARELAEMSGGDADAISQARRVVLARLRDRPDPATRQVYWLIRRGIELGAPRWPWVETDPVP